MLRNGPHILGKKEALVFRANVLDPDFFSKLSSDKNKSCIKLSGFACWHLSCTIKNNKHSPFNNLNDQTKMTQNKEIHGHEVMDMMIKSGKKYSRNSLRTEIHETFGKTTLFFACSAQGLDADGLIDFLDSKNKFSGTPDSFQLASSTHCDH